MRTITIIDRGVKGQPVTLAVTSEKGLDVLSNDTLLAIYNAATGKATKKFARRSKALAQTWASIQEFSEIYAGASPPALRRGEAGGLIPSPVSDPEPTVPAAAVPVRGRPMVRPWKCLRQPDGTYLFNMQPRTARATPGGRRPELITQLRKRPTFRQLLQRFSVSGETDEQKAFNLATSITCMGGTCGYGVVTAADGRLDLLEPVA